MPAIPPFVLPSVRRQFQRIHSTVISIRKPSGTTTVASYPFISGVTVASDWTTYNNFACSVFDMLSGKINRLFDSRPLTEVVSELGLLRESVFIIVYVCDIELTTGVLNNLVVGDEVQIHSEWWRVVRVVADSEGIQHEALVTK